MKTQIDTDLLRSGFIATGMLERYSNSIIEVKVYPPNLSEISMLIFCGYVLKSKLWLYAIYVITDFTVIRK